MVKSLQVEKVECAGDCIAEECSSATKCPFGWCQLLVEVNGSNLEQVSLQ